MEPDSSVFGALNTDVVLRMILNNLDSSTLLQCRLVNHKFYTQATSILKWKRGPVWLKDFDWLQEEFSELYTLAANSKNFPFTGISLVMEGRKGFWDLETDAAKRFFIAFGSSFSYLRINSFLIHWPEQLKLVLVSYLPSIRTLELDAYYIRKGYTRLDRDMTDLGYTLPKLGRIKFVSCSYNDFKYPKTRTSWYRRQYCRQAGMERLLRAAPHLESIEGSLESDNAEVLMAICATNNWHKVSHLIVWNNGQTYRNFSHSVVKGTVALGSPSPTSSWLTNVTLSGSELPRNCCDYTSQFYHYVSALLRASRNTLETLAVTGTCALPVFSDVLVTFPRLKILAVEHGTKFHAAGSSLVAPRAATTATKQFPVLKEIRLSLHTDDTTKMPLEGFWSCGGVCWDSVEKLQLELTCYRNPREDETLNFYTCLLKTLPVVKHVCIRFHEYPGHRLNTTTAAQQVWFVRELPMLESLEIQGLPLGRQSLFQLDEFLSGISHDACDETSTKRRKSDMAGTPQATTMRADGGVLQIPGTNVRELVLRMTENDWRTHGRGNQLAANSSLWRGIVERASGCYLILSIFHPRGSHTFLLKQLSLLPNASRI